MCERERHRCWRQCTSEEGGEGGGGRGIRGGGGGTSWIIHRSGVDWSTGNPTRARTNSLNCAATSSFCPPPKVVAGFG